MSEPSWQDMYHREREAVERLSKENAELRATLNKWGVFIKNEIEVAHLLEDAVAKVKRQAERPLR